MSHWVRGESVEWSAEQELEAHARDDESDEERFHVHGNPGDDEHSEQESVYFGSSIANGDDEADEPDTVHCFFRMSSRYEYENNIAFNVWTAKDHEDGGREVVVKVEPYARTHVDGQPPKGVRVLQTLNRVGAPFVPTLRSWYDMGPGRLNEEERRYIVASDRIECLGRDEALEVLFNDEAKTRSYMRQLFEAVKKTHEIGIIHRDLKPGNILWNDDTGTLSLVDWTLSTFKRPNGKQHTRYVGTRAYKCPEMDADVPYDYRCDLYSLGIICGQFAMHADDQIVEADEVASWRREYRRYHTDATGGRCADRTKGKPRRRANRKKFVVLNTDKKRLLDLFAKLTTRDPEDRISIDDALAHPYFT